MTNPTANFLDSAALDALVQRAAASPRRRLNLNLHPQLADPIQRFLNAAEPGTYVRPHRHQAARWEMFAAMRGQMDILLFADDGAVAQRFTLAPGHGVIEVAGGSWHSFVIMAPATVALEIKPGPYIAETDKEFAAWAPRENEPGADRIVRWFETAHPGERWPMR